MTSKESEGEEKREDREERYQNDVASIRDEAIETYERIRESARSAWMAAFDGNSPVADESSRSHLAKDHQNRLEKRRRRDKRKAVELQVTLNSASTRAEVFHERTIGTDDFLRLDYFVRGLVAARCIGRIDALTYYGTGFICAPGYIITNNHVISSVEEAQIAGIGFEKHNGRSITPDTFICTLAPERFFWTSPKDELDLTIVALEPTHGGGEDIAYELGWHRLLAEEGKIVLGDPTSIIQYPSGAGKRTVVHNSSLVYVENRDRGSKADKRLDRYLWYTSDTEPGSSGSPIFNKHWEVVGVHHASIPKKNTDGDYVDDRGRSLTEAQINESPARAVWVANQGVRTSRIVKALEAARFPGPTSADAKSMFAGSAESFDQQRQFILGCWQAKDGQEAVLMRTRRRIAQIQALERGEEARAGLAPPQAHPAPPFVESGMAQGGLAGTTFEEELIRRLRVGGLTINIGRI